MIYINNIPKSRVYQHHLAGHRYQGHAIIDTHDAAISNHVWELYAKAVDVFDPISTMIERDDAIPPLQDLLEELEHARSIYCNALIQQEVSL